MAKEKPRLVAKLEALTDAQTRGVGIKFINNRVTSVHGVSVEISSADEAETADIVICGTPPTNFPDDVLTSCIDCGRVVCHRPHAPKAPPKLCVWCAVARMRAGGLEIPEALLRYIR